DWNLELAQAKRESRPRVYAERASDLRSAVRRADLPPPDRDLADSLLENGSWLAGEDDPAGAAGRFDDLAETLLAQLDAATTKKDAKRLKRLAKLYARLGERGIDASLRKAEKSGALNLERKRKLEKVIRRDAKRARKLAELLERAPDASRKEIRRA